MSTEDKPVERKGDEILRRLLNTPPDHRTGNKPKEKGDERKPPPLKKPKKNG
ncbi:MULTISPECIES: hypothetical protein [unclassified Mesorhizobium]|uniref:hypothetical protein n=1 Tax=unclassified Mesorhizobium TaxID=325217 RepID=UPI0013DE8A76|nr:MULTISPECIES: hypothetical protein [unclassified Mesorhizobium]